MTRIELTEIIRGNATYLEEFNSRVTTYVSGGGSLVFSVELAYLYMEGVVRRDWCYGEALTLGATPTPGTTRKYRKLLGILGLGLVLAFAMGSCSAAKPHDQDKPPCTTDSECLETCPANDEECDGGPQSCRAGDLSCDEDAVWARVQICSSDGNPQHRLHCMDDLAKAIKKAKGFPDPAVNGTVTTRKGTRK
jgi:hypothetical protein